MFKGSSIILVNNNRLIAFVGGVIFSGISSLKILVSLSTIDAFCEQKFQINSPFSLWETGLQLLSLLLPVSPVFATVGRTSIREDERSCRVFEVVTFIFVQ